jgi:TonB family protein
VSAAGVVENLSVVDSSDAVFEDSAVRAVSRWRYLPRIVAGNRVATTDLKVAVWFEPGEKTPPDASKEQRASAAARAFEQFSSDLEVALDRLAADDLRGAELQLDEMRAIYPAAGFFHGDLWGFYGYLFTVQGNYDRAIEAYETALASYASNGAPGTMGPRDPLANLYFARHQYDLALKTLLRPNLGGGNVLLSREGRALAEKLKALGVTQEPL